MSWRLIYKDEDVIDLFESSGVTYTQKNLFVSNTLDECFTKIDDLKLNAVYNIDNERIIFSGGTRTIEDINDL